MAKLILADLEATSVQMEVAHPTLGPQGVFLEVVGPDNPQFRSLRDSFLKRRLAMGDSYKPDFDEAIKQHNELLLTCVVGWSDDEFFGGPFSKEKMLDILRNTKLAWLREQLDEFTNSRNNFFRRDGEQSS